MNINKNLTTRQNPRFINAGQMFSSIPNQFEPIRKDLFSVEFPLEMNIPENLIASAARPKITNAQKEVMFKNLSTYYKGKTKHETIQMTFRDTIGVSIFQKLQAWQRQHTDFANGKGGYAATYKKTLTLNMEAPDGTVIQKFRLFGCFIIDIDGGEVNMDSDDIAMVTMTLSVDSSELVL